MRFEMDAPNHSACLVLAGFCFLLGFASQLLRALAERSEAAWGGGRELDDTLVVPRHTRPACMWPPPRRLSDTPAAAHASLKPRSEDRSALSQLRAAGEAAWGGGPMPAALDDEVYIAALLEKQRRDHAADVTYARRKLVAAVRWRSEAASAASSSSSSSSSSSAAAAAAAAAAEGEAADGATGAGEAATAAGKEAAAAGEAAAAWDLAAPAATHSVVRRVPCVRRLLRGCRPEPLLS